MHRKPATLAALLAVTLLAGSSAVVAAPVGAVAKFPTPEQQAVLNQTFFDYDLYTLDVAEVERQARAGAIRLELGNRSVNLLVEKNNLRGENYSAVFETKNGPIVVPERPVVTYKGRLAGNPDSIVRLTAKPDHFTGYVKTRDEWLFIDPLGDFVDGAGQRDVVVYRATDVRPDPNRACGSHDFESLASNIDLRSPRIISSAAGTLRAEVASEVDGEFAEEYGIEVGLDRIETTMNAVDGIYQAQLGLEISLAKSHGWADADTDPYTSNDAFVTLDQLVAWWNDNLNSPRRDIVHMFAARNFQFGIAGIAYVGVVCNVQSLSFGISEDLNSSFDRITVAAHEIGHNFDALHDDEIGCPGVNCNGFGPIMCSFIQGNGSQTFSSCSVDDIGQHVAQNPRCLD